MMKAVQGGASLGEREQVARACDIDPQGGLAAHGQIVDGCEMEDLCHAGGGNASAAEPQARQRDITLHEVDPAGERRFAGQQFGSPLAGQSGKFRLHEADRLRLRAEREEPGQELRAQEAWESGEQNGGHGCV